MTAARPAPLVPPEHLADWITELRHIAEDLDFGLAPPAAATRVRALLNQIRADAYRKDPA
ncbi:hypothetical protein [Pseudonocardia parietis]|uniref:Uncharacterized protein n=1 Tax=Pseudonocardia parietis TaxID=570936 RepID=A0ABS4W2C3_9PSEU|nr:hypothetical protein [Pseudonocardia parietis]MBP2370263.1 hypothetical protein [Pseudonocardia parietis]